MTISDLSASLRLATFRLARRLRAQKSDEALSDPQFAVLATLSMDGSRTLSALAERERVSAPSMNRTVNCLADAGYVQRTEDGEDRRKTNIALTESGAAVVRATVTKRDAWLTGHLRALSPEERATLAEAAAIMARIAAR